MRLERLPSPETATIEAGIESYLNERNRPAAEITGSVATRI